MTRGSYLISRADLFEKVWSAPMSKISKEIGVSDVALAKACKRAGIPTPPQGHWLRKYKSQRPKLPPTSAQQSDQVEFRGLAEAEVERVRAQIQERASSSDAPKIKIPSSLSGAHPLVRGTFRRGSDHFHGRIYLMKGSLDLRVSDKQLERAKRIAHGLITASEALGYSWKVADGETLVSLGTTTFQVHFIERISKQPAAKARHWDATEWMSTGELSFIVDTYTPSPVRKLWKDSNTGTLEERMGEALATFPSVIEGVELHKAELLAWRREREAEECRRAEAAKQAELQCLLRDRLADTVVAWENSERIRSLCRAVSSHLSEMSALDRDAADLWLAWAASQADILDPFRRQSKDWMLLTALGGISGKHDTHWWT